MGYKVVFAPQAHDRLGEIVRFIARLRNCTEPSLSNPKLAQSSD